MTKLHQTSPRGFAPSAPYDKLRLGPVLLALFMTALLGLFVAASPKSGQPVGLIFPPWTTTAQMFDVIEAADGQIVDIGAVHWVAIAKSDVPDFANRLQRLASLLVVDGALTNAVCGSRSTMERG